MNPAFWLLVLLIAFVVWVLSRPLWKPFGGWLYNRTEKINETINAEEKVDNGEKGEEKE